MNIDIDLRGATHEQRAKFEEPFLSTTLAALREAAGDSLAVVRVKSVGPAITHVIQAHEDFCRSGESAASDAPR